ncbi:MAG TPA: phage tail protein [Methylophilus sp.]|uniref:phage tail protein n=1 Tax=Methylophilus sp. TaxID=29541 RepID=UPI002D141641|nr:phage tail protein [Methylophilus sp.]HSH86891.1 phage tail protein [Methylophilus sp.]
MSVQLPNGAIVSIATALAAAIAVSAATNASEAVLTTATNTYSAGDFVLYSSGWSKANDRVFRVKTATGTSVTLEGFDTANTDNYPAGSGAGSLRKVTTWQQISQILEWTGEGGDMQTTKYQFLEADAENEISTVASASAINYTLADDVTNPGYLAIKAISDVRGAAPLRVSLTSGAKLLFQVGVRINPIPTMTKNEVMGVVGRLSIKGEVVRYAS